MTVTAYTPTQVWQQTYFGKDRNNPAVAGDNADPDNDGLPNLLERALGTSPTAPDKAVLNNNALVMVYPLAKRAIDVPVQPQWSADLATWSSQGISAQVLSDDGIVQRVQVSVPVGGNAKLFLRLRVTRP